MRGMYSVGSGEWKTIRRRYSRPLLLRGKHVATYSEKKRKTKTTQFMGRLFTFAVACLRRSCYSCVDACR